MELLINQNHQNSTLHAVVKTHVSCPVCRHNYCERVPRAKMVKVLFFWANVKRYRCFRCSHKFYTIPSHKKELADMMAGVIFEQLN